MADPSIACLAIGKCLPLPTAVVCRSFAQHAATTSIPHFVGDACTMVLFRTGLIEALDI